MEDQGCIFRFADVEVHERNFSVVKAGEVLAVEPKVFRVLQFLLHHADRVVTKDELLNAVWNDCSVSESSLTRSVAILRRMLGDDIHEPRFIATVPTIGYRFICDVQVTEDGFAVPRTANAAPSASMQVAQTTPATLVTPGRRIAIIAALAACAVFAAVFGWFWQRQHRRARAAVSVRLIPLTTYPGIAQHPSLSPDGSQVAFSWNGPDEGNFDIYVKTAAAGTAGQFLPYGLPPTQPTTSIQCGHPTEAQLPSCERSTQRTSSKFF